MGIAAMITSIKFNDRRNKREAFDGWISSDKESQGIKIEPVSEKVLQEIRDKLEKQRRTLFRKRLIGFGMVLISIVGALLYLTFLN